MTDPLSRRLLPSCVRSCAPTVRAQRCARPHRADPRRSAIAATELGLSLDRGDRKRPGSAASLLSAWWHRLDKSALESVNDLAQRKQITELAESTCRDDVVSARRCPTSVRNAPIRPCRRNERATAVW